MLHRRVLLWILLLTATVTVSAHPVNTTPNEAVGSGGTLISLMRILSLAVTAGWAAYTFLGDRSVTISWRGYALAYLLVPLSLWSDLALDWVRTNDVTLDRSFFAFDLQFLRLTLQSDRAALLWVRIIGALLLIAPVLNKRPFARWIALIGGAIVAFVSAWAATTPATFTAAAQAVVTPYAQLGQIASQGLHLYLAALWFGGIILALAGIVRHQIPMPVSMRSLLRYTQFCLAAIAVTGIILAWVRVGSVPALLQTNYGWLTLIKAGVVIGLMTLGTRWTKRISTRQATSVGQNASPQRSLVVEGGLLVVALIASGMLTTLDSARSITESRSDEYFHSFDNSFYEVRIERPLEIDLIVIPGLTGENRVIVTLIDSEVGTRLDDAGRVVVNLTPQSTGIPTSVTLEPATDGNYAEVTSLAATGAWNAEVSVSRQDITRTANFVFTVQTPPPDLPSLTSVEEPITFTLFDRIVSGVGGVLLVLLGVSEFISVRRRTATYRIVIVLSGLCAVIGLTLLVAATL